MNVCTISPLFHHGFHDSRKSKRSPLQDSVTHFAKKSIWLIFVRSRKASLKPESLSKKEKENKVSGSI
jgi:hypothetical protein